MLTQSQKQAAFAIVNVFETGQVQGDYGNVTLIPGDPGHLTYGRSQTTLVAGKGAGNLWKLLERYCASAGARFSHRLKPYVDRARHADLALDTDLRFKNLLRACADDAVMRDVQDAFFEETYWQPATRAAAKAGLVLPLSQAVVYDSFIHGAWATVSAATSSSAGSPAAIGEKAWVTAYVATRRDWLAKNAKPVLRSTVYRMDAFQRLIDFHLWALELPFMVRGEEVSTTALSALPPNCYVGPAPGSRALGVQTPLLRGLDVRLFQLGLSEAGCDVTADGIFGKGSQLALRGFQQKNGQTQTALASAELVAQFAAQFS
ncbi:MAG: chitosanase [Zoogloea sp.]|nr:chitosanase [Zoogloea sp.]